MFSMTPGPPGPAGTPGLPGLDVSVYICRYVKKNIYIPQLTGAEITITSSSTDTRARTDSQAGRGMLDPKETRGKG